MIRPLATLLLATSALVPVAVQAQELPSAGTVVAGSAQIVAPTPSAMTITQGSDRAIINWQSFSIGEGGRVDIFQPDAGSVLLNRVTGDTGSRIAGTLNANGQVYVVNPNGILITGTGSVNAAGFVASTLGISDDRFMRGDIVVNGQGGSVRNEGRISIVKGGYAALIGGKVDNAGLIVAPLGRVGLGSGTRATLDLNGDGFLQVALPAAGEGGVAMSGRIAADGGSVLLTAASAVNAARHTVNLSGVIEARGVAGRNGSVVLTGPDIALTGAVIDVSGASGGGTVKIGGDYMGGGTLPRAATLTVDAASHIRADATGAGDGGNIILWSDKATHFAGTISARGAGAGKGGDAEVSSKGLLGYTGHADLRGTAFGTLLLDPYNVIISNAPNANTPGFVPSGNDSIINSTTLQNALATANVTVATGGAGSPGSQAGNITVADALSWSSGSTLTLNAFGAIAINAPITVTGAGGVALLYNAASTTNLRFGARGSIDYGATDLGGTLSINGSAYKLIYNMAQLDAIDGRDDATGLATPAFGPGLTGRYALATNLNAAGKTYTTGLIAGGGPDGAPRPTGFSGTLTGLGNSISNLTIAGGGNAFVGLVGVSSGTLRDIAIIDSHVSGWHDVGGLAGLNSGVIAQAFASGVVSGGNGAYSLGGIAGASIGTITDSGSSSKIIGGDGAKQLGGLVGYVGNAIVRSYATGAVSGGDGAFLVGGLTGINFGTITASYATGAVSGEGVGAGYMGGLVGQNSGDIHQSYATGAVRGNQILGGLVGLNTNAGTTISQSYATGLVHSTMAGPFLGGLAGFNQNGATITNSYWDKQTSGRATSSGGAGATGLTTAQLQSGLLPAGFDTAVWGQAAGFNPFLKHQTTVTNSIAGDRTIDGAFAASVNMLLAERNVVIGAGNILVDASLAWSTDRTLSLNADTALTINAPINVTGGVALRYDAASATNLGFGTNGSIDFGATDLGGRLSINGDAYALIYTMAQLDAIDGRDDVGGTGVAIFGVGLTGRYALATNLNAAGTTYGSGLIAGGDQSGNAPTKFSGTLTGLGHSISGLTIVGGANGRIGLVGDLSGTVRDIGMIGGSASGIGLVGGLVGASSGTIVHAYATGTVSGGDGVNMLGGLVGYNRGAIIRSYATGAVSAANGSFNLGGLVGKSEAGATITQSYATGSVTGGANLHGAGGLVGGNSGDIRESYASGNVSGGDGALRLGGLAGSNGGIIAQSHATGNIFGGDNLYGLGGLVGDNSGEISESRASGTVTGGFSADRLGGLVGTNGVLGKIALSHASGNISGDDELYAAAGLVGENEGDISESYATGTVSGGIGSLLLGGLVGDNFSTATITLSHATGDITAGDSSYWVGGLAGYNSGEIAQSHATGTLSGGDGVSKLGGLVGFNDGAISQSHATGAVSGGDDANTLGGLAGYNSGTITDTYATGAVSGADRASNLGGLVGKSDTGATITESHATGNITGGGDLQAAGGLVGDNSGEIGESYASGAVSGGTGSVRLGGLVGDNLETGQITLSYASGTIAAGDDSYSIGGLAGNNDGTIAESYATGAVNGGDFTTELGGLVGTNSAAGIVTDSYAIGAVTGGEYSYALGGLAGVNAGAITTSHAKGAVSGGTAVYYIGGLIGVNGIDAVVTQSYATGAVGGASAEYAGGLVGKNEGAIASSYATGDVSVGDGGLQQIGGLVGTHESGSITQSYATGNVRGGQGAQAIGGLVGAQTGGTISQSYATGAVGGGDGAMQLGGLVGFKFDGSITQSYATGSVISGQNGLHLGGFVGLNFAGDISESYSRGVVSGGAGTIDAGGFVGLRQSGTIATSYWDTQTSGWTSAAAGNGTGLTTAQFQSGTLPIGFDPAVWGTGPGLYPYLKHFFPNGMQVVSGFAWRADGSAMASGVNGAIRVSIAHDGTVAGSATTGANGYYYVILPVGTLTSDTGFAAFTQNNAVTGAQDAVTYRAGGASESNSGIDLTGGWRRDLAGVISTLSALDAGYAAAIGATAPSGFILNNRQIDADGGFLLDQALSVAGTLALSAAGDVGQSAAITARNLRLGGASARYTLTNAANAIDNLAAAQLASLNVVSSKALTIASGLRDASGVAAHGVTASGDIRIVSSGDLDIASGARIAGGNPLLIAGGAFVNHQGADAVSATSGRWLIYSADPAGNRFGNLDSGNHALWNTAAGGAVSVTGNRYVFAKQPTLTISARDGSKIYGEDGAAYVAGLYVVSGFDAGVAGAYLADNAASALSGAPALSSTGSATTAGVSGSPYSIALGAGTLAATSGYALTFGGPGQLIVTPRALTITADALSRIYGNANPATGTATGDNLVNGDTIGGVTLGTPATTASGIDSYDLTGSAAAGTGLGNYAISYTTRAGGLTITPRALTITADAIGRIYGDANLATGTATADNLVNGDMISGVTLGTPATTASGIGSYDLAGSAATGTGLGNYTITYATRTGGLTITPRALIITADALSRVYGAANPALIYRIGGGGLVNGDLLNVELATLAAPTSTPGRYAITQGSLAASPNYILNYVPNVLTVTPPLFTSAENRAATQQRDGLMSANAAPSNLSFMRVVADTEGDAIVIVSDTPTTSCVLWQPCAPSDNSEVPDQKSGTY